MSEPADALDHLAEKETLGSARTPDLFAEVVPEACTRLAVLRTVGKNGPYDGGTRQSDVGLSAGTETSL
jgi:hypothetical protein